MAPPPRVNVTQQLQQTSVTKAGTNLPEQQSEVNVSYMDGHFKYIHPAPPQKKTPHNNNNNNKQTTEGVHGTLPWQTDTVTTVSIEDGIQTLSRTRGDTLSCLSCPYIFLARAQSAAAGASQKSSCDTLVNTVQCITESGPTNIPFRNDDDDDCHGLQTC